VDLSADTEFAAAMIRRGWLWLLRNTLNRVTAPLARAGIGPFSLVRHVGRRTGRIYETPLLLVRVADGFVAELTYGPRVAWYRNVVAAGGCTIIDRGVEYRIDGVDAVGTESGLRAFGNPAALVLRLLRRREFRLLRIAADRPA
jgi:deazaflavin-dependent oxidoreductase (nitroreductase family)